jgi:hypothetical protein
VNVTGFERVDEIHQAFDTAPETIEFPNDQRVAGT